MRETFSLHEDRLCAAFLHALAERDGRAQLHDLPEIGTALDRLVAEKFVEVHPGALVRQGARGSLLSKARTSALLRTGWIGSDLEIHAETRSTNELMLERAAAGAPAGLTIAAEMQTAGRGRRGNSFESRPGLGLWVSVLLRAPANPENSPRLSLIAAIAASRAIETMCAELPLLKWPNDVLLRGRKVAGVLVEARTVGARMFPVAGIGINVHHRSADFAPGVRERAASIEAICRTRVDRSLLLAHLLHELERLLEEESAGALDLCSEWAGRDSLAGRDVALVIDGEETAVGRAGGIEPDGRFRLVRSDHSVVRARSGEASLKER